MASSEEDLGIGQVDIVMVADLISEPSYISEIARKLIQTNMPFGLREAQLDTLESFTDTWGDFNLERAIVNVTVILGTIHEREGFELETYDYDSDEFVFGASQRIGSEKFSLGEGDVTKEWKQYTVVHRELEEGRVGEIYDEHGWQELGSRLRERVDQDVSIDDKLDLVRTVSRRGNEHSRLFEKIMQDQLSNEFISRVRPPEVLETPGYNDPSFDIFALNFRLYQPIVREVKKGVVVEVSTRYVNPLGDPYISGKLQHAIELEEEYGEIVDIFVIAPSIRNNILERYKNDDIIQLFEFPNGEGSPVIIPDDPELREALEGTDVVGEQYPLVTELDDKYVNALETLGREFTVVTESDYRIFLSNTVTTNID